MSEPAFQLRLQRVMQTGNLTVADLARWFDRPYPTVSGWVQGGPLGGAPLDARHITTLLAILEKKIKIQDGLPVPRLTPQARIRYLNKLRVESIFAG